MTTMMYENVSIDLSKECEVTQKYTVPETNKIYPSDLFVGLFFLFFYILLEKVQ